MTKLLSRRGNRRAVSNSYELHKSKEVMGRGVESKDAKEVCLSYLLMRRSLRSLTISSVENGVDSDESK